MLRMQPGALREKAGTRRGAGMSNEVIQVYARY